MFYFRITEIYENWGSLFRPNRDLPNLCFSVLLMTSRPYLLGAIVYFSTSEILRLYNFHNHFRVKLISDSWFYYLIVRSVRICVPSAKFGFETKEICVLLMKISIDNCDSDRSHWICRSGSLFLLENVTFQPTRKFIISAN